MPASTRPPREYLDRVKVGSWYTNGPSEWEVVEVRHTTDLGSVVIRNWNEARERHLGIGAFRQEFWQR